MNSMIIAMPMRLYMGMLIPKLLRNISDMPTGGGAIISAARNNGRPASRFLDTSIRYRPCSPRYIPKADKKNKPPFWNLRRCSGASCILSTKPLVFIFSPDTSHGDCTCLHITVSHVNMTMPSNYYCAHTLNWHPIPIRTLSTSACTLSGS